MKRHPFSRILSLCMALVLLAGIGLPSCSIAEDIATVKVKNYKQLIEAVSSGATDITIDKNWQQGTAEMRSNIYLENGTTVTIHGGTEETRLLKATFDIYGRNGGGTLILDGIDLEAMPDQPAMWVGGENAKVQAGNLSGGKVTSGSGISVLIVESNASITAGRITGASIKTAATGGDGVFASDQATVVVESITAGQSDKGYGGTAVCATNQAQVTVNGDAIGGNGLIAPGWAVRATETSNVTIAGNSTDGIQLESKKPITVPEAADSFAALKYMLRRGDTDITVSSKFKYGENDASMDKKESSQGWFTLNSNTVRVHLQEEAKKNVVMSGCHEFYAGKFEISGIDINSKSDLALGLHDSDIIFNGNITSSGLALGLYDGNVIFSGNITSSGSQVACGIYGGEAIINGNITSSGTACATYVTGGTAVINGNITAKGGNALNIRSGSKVTVTGNLQNTGIKDKTHYPCIYAKGRANCEIKGNVSSKGGGAVYAGGNTSITITGNIIEKQFTPVQVYEYAQVRIVGDFDTSKKYYQIYLQNHAQVALENTKELNRKGAFNGKPFFSDNSMTWFAEGDDTVLTLKNTDTMEEYKETRNMSADERVPHHYQGNTEPASPVYKADEVNEIGMQLAEMIRNACQEVEDIEFEDIAIPEIGIRTLSDDWYIFEFPVNIIRERVDKCEHLYYSDFRCMLKDSYDDNDRDLTYSDPWEIDIAWPEVSLLTKGYNLKYDKYIMEIARLFNLISRYSEQLATTAAYQDFNTPLFQFSMDCVSHNNGPWVNEFKLEFSTPLKAYHQSGTEAGTNRLVFATSENECTQERITNDMKVYSDFANKTYDAFDLLWNERTTQTANSVFEEIFGVSAQSFLSEQDRFISGTVIPDLTNFVICDDITQTSDNMITYSFNFFSNSWDIADIVKVYTDALTDNGFNVEYDETSQKYSILYNGKDIANLIIDSKYDLTIIYDHN